MAPGYRSPFDHPPSPKPIQRADCMLPIVAILLCVSIILCLALFTFCAAHNEHLQPKDGTAQEMTLDQVSIPKYLAARSSEDLRRAIDIREVFPREESGGDTVQRPLLPREPCSGPLREDQDPYVVKMASRRDTNGYEQGSINWHGTNTLNTSWGWDGLE
ncbi:hypothetical protein V8C42DRAFT_196057 [Trichoderma barbatum]